MYTNAEIIKNHLFVQLPRGRWLVDTGSTKSFGEELLTIENREFTVSRSLGPISLEQIRNFVGVDFVGLIGTDILNRYICHFDLPKGRLGFLDELPEDLPGRRIPLELILGSTPVVTALVEDLGEQRLVLDTGAQYSYLTTPPAEYVPRVGRGTDFHPQLGSYDVEFILRHIQIGSLREDLRLAWHPGVTQLCAKAKVDGIMGLEPFLARSIVYNPNAMMLWV